MPSAPRTFEEGRIRRALVAGGGVLLALALWGRLGAVERVVGVPAESLGWGLGLFCLLLALHGLALVVAGRRPWRERVAIGDDPHGSLRRRDLVTLAAIVLAALALRLWHLESGLWHDEIGTLIEFVRPEPGTILTSFRNQNQHMLYSLLAHASISVLGETAAALRLPAALFGVAGIPALFVLARKVATTGEALGASALLAASYHHVWFSQNARGYTGVLVFTLLATWAWLEALEHDDWPRWLAYVGAVALGMWVHLTMTFVVAAHGLVFLGLVAAARLDPGGRAGSTPAAVAAPARAFAAFTLCVTVTAQLYALGLPVFFSSGLHEVSLESDWISPWWLVVETARGLAAGFSGPVLAVGLVALAVGGLVSILGWLGIWRRNAPLAIVMVLPGVLVVGLMVALRHNLWPRFLFFCAGFALVILVRGGFEGAARLARLVSWSPERGRLVATAFVAILIALSLASLPRYYSLPKQDYRGAMDFVDGRLAPRDAAVTVGLARVAYEELYAVGRASWTGAEDAAELDRLRREHDDLWLIYSLPTHLERWHPDVWGTIQTDFEEVRVFPGSLRGGEVRVLRSRRRGVDEPRL